jgi:hypothetical protein
VEEKGKCCDCGAEVVGKSKRCEPCKIASARKQSREGARAWRELHPGPNVLAKDVEKLKPGAEKIVRTFSIYQGSGAKGRHGVGATMPIRVTEIRLRLPIFKGDESCLEMDGSLPDVQTANAGPR